MTVSIDYKSPRTWITLVVFIVVVIGVGGLIGSQSTPGAWYESLNKPPFNPPNWIFGPVWSTLYLMIAVAGWRIWMLAPASTAMKLWFAQMIFNWIWSPVWFIGEMLWPAFAIITVILVLIVAFILVARQRDTVAAWLFVPYAVWVGFASILNLSIAILN
ncbi:TspO/MBR family protein [Devosia neptuniae]|jgi:benzodiazapine receptor|uniref:TspO/MBR family protein n=1 Tax=Devosia TaxID=46913 RepID=UPI0022AED8F5|nr:TspO/MBR family protein [Devosia neptuniae]MCZ4346064.1 tryptophan-rich sensory protein [Devosia neptuniae]|tara:strand:- start:158598 stop:159077 length:480 start_codon:yes stop_codon:yes gene_type:complete